MELVGLLGLLGFLVGAGWLLVAVIKKREKETPVGLLVIGLIVFFVGIAFTPSSDEGKEQVIDTTVETSVIEETKKSSVEKTEEEKESKDEFDLEIDEINKYVAEHLEHNKGWALGTIDDNANPIDNGEPNHEYGIWLYVNSIVYNGNDVEVQVTADFLDFTEDEKNEIGKSSQGIVMSFGVLDKRPHVFVFNGENSYGGSTILDAMKFKWIK